MTPVVIGPAALLLVFCILAETLQQLSFKSGAARAQGALAVLRQPLVWAGVALWAVESIAWVQALERVPLTMAYPVMTLTYATVPLAGVMLLGERLSRRQAAGAALIVAGAALVGLAGA